MCTVSVITKDFNNIRNYLSKFSGGQVILQKDADSGIAYMFLDHVKKRNAMSGKMMVQFRDCIEELEKWKEGKGLILCGKGTNFCSGGDLDFARAAGTAQSGFDLSTWMHDTLIRLQKLPLVSVCLASGPTIGAGAEISVYCDFVIVTDEVKYGFVQAKMGLTTVWGGGVRLVDKIGQTKALDLLLSSKILNGKECVEIGIAEKMFPKEVAYAETVAWLTSKLLHHYSITRALKKIVSNTSFHTYRKACNLEKYIFAPFWGSEINQEALKNNIKHT